MRRIIGLATFITICAGPALGQLERSWSVVGGLGSSTLHGSSIFKGTEARSSALAGFGVQLPLSSNIAIRTGVQYSEKGAVVENNELVGSLDWKFDYLEVPVLAAVSFQNFVISAGPVVGLNFNDEFRNSRRTDSPGIKAIDVGAGLGISYRVARSPQRESMELGVFYNIGLTSTSDGLTATNSEDVLLEQKNSALHLVISLSMPF